MALEVILPRVDMDMSTGRISRWHVAEGEAVEKGQPLFEIETDKAAMEIEAPGSGILRHVVAADTAAIPVGAVVGWICAPGESPAAPAGPAPREPEPAIAASDAVATAPAAQESVAPAAVTATPLARRLARQHDIALDRIAGSGPRQRIQARDVAMASATVAAGRVGLHRAWLRRGQGTPLVLIHGFGAELNGWRPLVASLAGGQPILAVDLPGHGQSPASEAPSLEGFAAVVADALAAEGVASAHLLGHSLGGAVAACLAGAASFEVRSLLLLAPAGLGPDINGAFLDGFTRARGEASLAPWLRLLVSDAAVLGDGFVRAVARARADVAVAAAQAEVARALFPDGTQALSIRDSLGRIDAPVRVVFGADDRIIPARHAQGLPGAVALHLFRGVGHMPHLEVRPALARIVAEHAHA